MKNREKITLIIFVIIFIGYNIVGYALDIDILKFLVINDNGFKMSVISTFIPVSMAYLIYYILKFLKLNIEL